MQKERWPFLCSLLSITRIFDRIILILDSELCGGLRRFVDDLSGWLSCGNSDLCLLNKDQPKSYLQTRSKEILNYEIMR